MIMRVKKPRVIVNMNNGANPPCIPSPRHSGLSALVQSSGYVVGTQKGVVGLGFSNSSLTNVTDGIVIEITRDRMNRGISR